MDELVISSLLKRIDEIVKEMEGQAEILESIERGEKSFKKDFFVQIINLKMISMPFVAELFIELTTLTESLYKIKLKEEKMLNNFQD